jgi:hypothetical protein
MNDQPRVPTKLRNAGALLFVLLVNAVIVGILLQNFLSGD